MTKIKGRDFDAVCTEVRFETGNLCFACETDDPDRIELVIINPHDDEYLAAMTWAISTNKIGGSESSLDFADSDAATATQH